MAKFDTERLNKKVKTIIQADLPAKLTEITAEYLVEDTAEFGASLTLDPIPDAAYFWNHPPRDFNNSRTFLVYGVEAVLPISSGVEAAKEYSIFIAIGHSGLKNPNTNSPKNSVESKLARYTRAVQEVLSENFDSLGGFSKLRIEEFPANPELQLETGETLQVSGLVFSATIA